MEYILVNKKGFVSPGIAFQVLKEFFSNRSYTSRLRLRQG